VGDVVAATSLSRRTLERRFAESVGHTPSVEIRRQHVERAKYLLTFTDWNLTRIAYASGLHSFRQMANLFRADVGCSPTQYRKKTKM
jgi:LacI family transcriptional regulator